MAAELVTATNNRDDTRDEVPINSRETTMADSTLDMTGEESPVINLGHGTRSLGPSDSSDTGSDVTGGAF